MKVHSHLSCSGVGTIAALRDLAAQELYQHTGEYSLSVYTPDKASHMKDGGGEQQRRAGVSCGLLVKLGLALSFSISLALTSVGHAPIWLLQAGVPYESI